MLKIRVQYSSAQGLACLAGCRVEALVLQVGFLTRSIICGYMD